MNLSLASQSARVKVSIFLGAALLVVCLLAPSSSADGRLLFAQGLKGDEELPPPEDTETQSPTAPPLPSFSPSTIPSLTPTVVLSKTPTLRPSNYPSLYPSLLPSLVPTEMPTSDPTLPFFEMSLVVPDIPDSDIVKVMDWIKKELTALKSPFCWKRSQGRGVGLIPQNCPSNRDKIGLLCYSKCRPGMSRVGFDCWQQCPSGFRDDGFFCRKAEYGRGAGYPIWDGGKCKRKHGSCEKWGALWYPKCRSGYRNVACCICRPNPFSCSGYGMANALPGIPSLSCRKTISTGDPTPMVCNSNQEKDAGLCYPRCPQGMYGVGPVCWSHCGGGKVDCGAACAASTGECASKVFDQVLSVLILAANVATLGLAAPVTAGAGATIRVAGKVVAGTTRLGKAMVKAVIFLQTVKSSNNLYKGVKVTKRIVNVRTGQLIKIVKLSYDAATIGVEAMEAMEDYRQSFSDDFAQQTSPRINRIIDDSFHPTTAEFLKKSWADIQLNEMKEAYGWQIADTVLDVASIVDITGVTGVVAAFADPVCSALVPFPCIDAATACP